MKLVKIEIVQSVSRLFSLLLRSASFRFYRYAPINYFNCTEWVRLHWFIKKGLATLCILVVFSSSIIRPSKYFPISLSVRLVLCRLWHIIDNYIHSFTVKSCLMQTLFTLSLKLCSRSALAPSVNEFHLVFAFVASVHLFIKFQPASGHGSNVRFIQKRISH